MKNLVSAICLFMLVTAGVLSGCKKSSFDTFYERPDSLAPPIYTQLSTRGNFKSLLALIDKSSYKHILSSASGYWTFFAPNDSAFSVYFKEKGISGIGAIDSVTATSMLQYWLIYNAYEKTRLDDYQATANNAGWTPDQAFRRRTAYYSSFYTDTGLNGKQIIALANNRNNLASSLTGNYEKTDYNNKYLTYFTDAYFNSHGLSAADYNYFYPNSQYTGFNVAEARVVKKDIPAESGVIHEVDRVITPLLSIEEYIKTKPEYSSFRALLNRLYANNMVQFIYNTDVTNRYRILKGGNDSVFIKAYSSLLAYSPNNENFLKVEENDGQKDCWTMFIPNNKAVDDFVKNTLTQYYPSLDQMPIGVIVDFINSHLFPTAVWPTKFGVTTNRFGESAKFDPSADVIDKKVLSNGFIYGTNKVQVANVFSTVYGKAYLNPNYSMMTRLFNVTGLKLLISQANVQTNIFLIPDKVFADSGYTYNVTKDQFEYKPVGASASTTNGVFDKLTRIAATCVFFPPYKQKLDNISGTGDIVKSGDVATDGDYIKFANSVVVTAGLQDNGRTAKVDSVKTASNGNVYYLNNILFYSEKPIGTHIKNLAASNPEYNSFYQFLLNSSIYTSNTAIAGLNGFSTIFVPNNAAILKAVNDGLLPGTGTAPNKVANPTSTSVTDKELVRKFIQYHILGDHTVIPDGNNAGSFNSFLQNAVGTNLKFTIASTPGTMTIVDNYNRTANVILSQSNNLSNRSVIHLIDNYLKYNY